MAQINSDCLRPVRGRLVGAVFLLRLTRVMEPSCHCHGLSDNFRLALASALSARSEHRNPPWQCRPNKADWPSPRTLRYVCASLLPSLLLFFRCAGLPLVVFLCTTTLYHTTTIILLLRCVAPVLWYASPFFSLFSWWCTCCMTRAAACSSSKQPNRLSLCSTSSCDNKNKKQTLAYASSRLFLSPSSCTHPLGPFPAATLRGTLQLPRTPQRLGG